MPTCETKTNKSAVSLPPPLVKWAQRPSLLFITICLEDCKNPKIDVKPDHLHFEGTGGPDKKDHEVTLNFLKEIDTEKSKYSVNDRAIVFALQKKVRITCLKNIYHAHTYIYVYIYIYLY